MIFIKQLFIYFFATFAVLNQVSAFFWSSSETTQHPYYLYQRRMPPTSYNIPYSEPSIPSVPIQVPLKAQLAPQPTIQNVQLVPCLCPVSTDYEYDKTAQQIQQIQESNFYSPPSTQIPMQNNLQQQQQKNRQN